MKLYNFIIEPEEESSGKSFTVVKELGILSSGQQLNIVEEYSVDTDSSGLDQLRISSISVVSTDDTDSIGGDKYGKY